jgi:transposase
MKRASKEIRDEILALRKQTLDHLAAATLPPELLTPEIRKIVEKTIAAVGQFDGSLEGINSMTVEKAIEVKEKFGTVLPVMKRFLKNAHKRLPHDPGGRKRKFSHSQRSQIVQEIVSLIAQGHELRTAKATVAQRYGVSLSTIQRVWKGRESLLPKP